jgi:hypothetical protein
MQAVTVGSEVTLLVRYSVQGEWLKWDLRSYDLGPAEMQVTLRSAAKR